MVVVVVFLPPPPPPRRLGTSSAPLGKDRGPRRGRPSYSNGLSSPTLVGSRRTRLASSHPSCTPPTSADATIARGCRMGSRPLHLAGRCPPPPLVGAADPTTTAGLRSPSPSTRTPLPGRRRKKRNPKGVRRKVLPSKRDVKAETTFRVSVRRLSHDDASSPLPRRWLLSHRAQTVPPCWR